MSVYSFAPGSPEYLASIINSLLGPGGGMGGGAGSGYTSPGDPGFGPGMGGGDINPAPIPGGGVVGPGFGLGPGGLGGGPGPAPSSPGVAYNPPAPAPPGGAPGPGGAEQHLPVNLMHLLAGHGLAGIIHSLLGGVGNRPVPPAPNLPAGTYTGPYAAQGLRTSNPDQAAQLWESRHPYAVHHGQVPDWVSHALAKAIQGATPNPAPAPSPTAQIQ